MVAVAIGWQIYELTHSAFALGLIGLVQFVPTLLLVLATGHVADRFERRAIASVCQAAQAVVVAAFVAALALGRLDAVLLFGGTLVIGIARAFEAPAIVALLPLLVERERLQRATADSTSANKIAQVAGPAVGGFLYVVSPLGVYAVSGLLLVVAAIAVLLTRPRVQTLDRRAPTLRTLFGGITFVVNHRIIFGAISLDLVAVIFGGATALLPIYAADILSTGAWGLGLLRAAPAVGAIFMSLFLGRSPLRRRVGVALFASVAAYGIATVVFAVSRSFALSFIALAISGLFDVVSQVIRHTLVQLETPDDMRGRVSAVNQMFTASSGQLGQFESGVVAAWYGTVPSAVIGGIGSIAIALAWMLMFPEIARIDALERSAAPAAKPVAT